MLGTRAPRAPHSGAVSLGFRPGLRKQLRGRQGGRTRAVPGPEAELVSGPSGVEGAVRAWAVDDVRPRDSGPAVSAPGAWPRAERTALSPRGAVSCADGLAPLGPRRSQPLAVFSRCRLPQSRKRPPRSSPSPQPGRALKEWGARLCPGTHGSTQRGYSARIPEATRSYATLVGFPCGSS